MCGSDEVLSAMSSMSKNSAPGMCSARYSALALRLAVGRCMEPSSDDEARRVEMRCQPVGLDQPFACVVCHAFPLPDCVVMAGLLALGLSSAGPDHPAIRGLGARGTLDPGTSPRMTARRASRERDADAPVELALLLDLGDDDRADLAGALDVRAAARLQVDRAALADDDEAHLAGARSAASPPWCARAAGWPRARRR